MANFAFSQSADDGDEDPYDKQSYFMVGVNYLSDNVYLGRKDSVVTPYLTPYLGYHLKNGLYAKAEASQALNKRRIDLFTLEAGYDHSFGENFEGGASIDKYFYNKNSNSIHASSKGSAGIYAQYNNEWVEPQINLNADFNKKTDYVIGLQLDHDFSLKNGQWKIAPTLVMNMGTQHYYEEYFINRLIKKDKTLKLNKVLANANKLVPMDYELSAKVTYRISKWLFTLTPTYVIPSSPAEITIAKKTFTEKLSNSFFMELDICLR